MRAQITPSSGNVFADLNLPHAEQLLGTADRLRAILDALRLAYTALKASEYMGWDSGWRCCPVCGADHDPRIHKDKPHEDDCELAAALAAIRALLPDIEAADVPQ